MLTKSSASNIIFFRKKLIRILMNRKAKWTAWTPQEDSLLLMLVHQYGCKWRRVALAYRDQDTAVDTTHLVAAIAKLLQPSGVDSV